MKTLRNLAIICSLSTLAACQTTPDSVVRKEHIGSIVGAVGGAWLGSNVGKGKGNIAAIAAGTLLGGFAGKQLGASLDKADLAYLENTTQKSLESGRDGEASTWKNPNSGRYGSITPTSTYMRGNQPCRNYSQIITVEGRKEEARGTACRQTDGSWLINS
jgi:surface antigen